MRQCRHAGQIIVCDGTPPDENPRIKVDERIKRVAWNDPLMGIFRGGMWMLGMMKRGRVPVITA